MGLKMKENGKAPMFGVDAWYIPGAATDLAQLSTL